jgi:hypothetical protein
MGTSLRARSSSFPPASARTPAAPACPWSAAWWRAVEPACRQVTGRACWVCRALARWGGSPSGYGRGVVAFSQWRRMPLLRRTQITCKFAGASTQVRRGTATARAGILQQRAARAHAQADRVSRGEKRPPPALREQRRSLPVAMPRRVVQRGASVLAAHGKVVVVVVPVRENRKSDQGGGKCVPVSQRVWPPSTLPPPSRSKHAWCRLWGQELCRSWRSTVSEYWWRWRGCVGLLI